MGAHLDKVLLAASGDAGTHASLDPAAGHSLDAQDWDESDWDDVRSHLESQSPWFGRVMAGENPGYPEPGEAHAQLSALLDGIFSLTPRTPEASTVHEPTVPPGGPGLFRIKGRELPPYVQHLYKHLVAKYGRHKAYGVAIGIVKKWAAGINPGGKGKGHHVHKDVQAAAAKNVANWEESRAMAHRHGHAGDHGHKDRKAAASAAGDALTLASVADYWRETPAGRMEEVSGYIKNDRERVGIISSASGGMAHKELQGLYKASKAHEAQFRGHLRDARTHYAAGRHAEAIASLQRAQGIARAHSFSFTGDALARQIRMVEARRQEQAQKAARAAVPEPRKKRFGLFTADSPLQRLELAREYERTEKGKREIVRPYVSRRTRRPWAKTIVFDYDGVLHSARGYHWPARTVDFSGIREAHKRKYNVAVVTANDPWRVADMLRSQGFGTEEDPRMKTLFWDGGESGRTVLVTGRKIAASAYVDDRAINHRWGDDFGHTLDQVDRIQDGLGPVGQNTDKVAFSAGQGLDTVVAFIELAAPAANPFGKPYKQSMLPPGPTTGLLQGQQLRTGVITNAPGTRPAMNAQLRHEPAQTVSPSPPLPPGVSLPKGKDVMALSRAIGDGADPSMATGIRKFLETAAGKLDDGDVDGALYALRGAQTSLHSAYRTAYGANAGNTAKVYDAGFAGAVPPAAQSSARTEMLKGREVTEKYRQQHHQVAGFIDQIRRAKFHGMYNGMPEARLAGMAHPLEMLAPGAVGVVSKAEPPSVTGNIPARLLRRRRDPGMVAPYRREEHGHAELVGGYDRLARDIEDTASEIPHEWGGHLNDAARHLSLGDGRSALNSLLSARTEAAVRGDAVHDRIMSHIRELRPHVALAAGSPLERVELAFGFVKAHERREHGKLEEVRPFERHPEALDWWHGAGSIASLPVPRGSLSSGSESRPGVRYVNSPHGGHIGSLVKQDGRWHAFHVDGTDTTPEGNRSREFALRHLEAYHNAVAAQPRSSPLHIAELEAEAKRLDPLEKLSRLQRLKGMSDDDLRFEHEASLDALESHFLGDESARAAEERHDEVVSELQRRGLWKSDKDVMGRLETDPHSLTDAELDRAFQLGVARGDGSHRKAIVESARRKNGYYAGVS